MFYGQIKVKYNFIMKYKYAWDIDLQNPFVSNNFFLL